jgi:hypothetical protein
MRARLRMTELKKSLPITSPLALNSRRTVFVSRSSSGFKLQMPLESASGSIGMARSGK